MSDDLILYAVGDIAPDRDDPSTLFENVREMIMQGDIAFCQLESVLSERGTPLPQARLVCRAKPQVARALKSAGFTIVSFASNHCMDLGREAFFDTLDVLNREGLAVIGAGRNIAEARKPAIIETKGTRVAFLSYNSILPQAYWAQSDRPGCVPMRAFTIYEQIEHDQPGTPCRIHTYPHRGDLSAMENDIRQAKAQADVVIISMHWGIHFIPAVIADYQRDVARAAIDVGADLILGHHAHILKGIEMYRGKAIFYSLCNFAIDLAAPKELLERPGHQELAKLNPDWVPDPEYPTYFMPRDARKTLIVKCAIADRQIQQVAFLPTYINPQSQPQVVRANDPRFNQVVEYIEKITRDQSLVAQFSVEGDTVAVHG
jgi:poly-gamma-glutamate synthesis protein (capsule biosynthesis protein)